jgi:hypothetical protein
MPGITFSWLQTCDVNLTPSSILRERKCTSSVSSTPCTNISHMISDSNRLQIIGFSQRSHLQWWWGLSAPETLRAMPVVA